MTVLAILDGKALSEWHSKLIFISNIAVGIQAARSALLLAILEGISQLGWFWYYN